jgi:cobalt/nickel transport system ATP-binding protein
MTDTLFSVTNVTFAYPGRPPCLRGVSCAIAAGERLALLGANGSGKTTLLHLLDGLYFPTAGAITAFGEALTEEAVERPPFGPRFRRAVGFLFQSADVMLFNPTVEDELAFGPLQLRLPADAVRQRVEDALALLDIADLRDRPPQALSSGQQKRVALAALLTLSPRVLLLDEPTAGLDPRSQAMLLELLDGLHAAGVTLVTATHDLTLIPHLADRALVLAEDGGLAADAPAEAVLHNTDLLLSVNLIHAHRHRHGAMEHAHPHVHVHGHEHGHG